MLKMEKQLTIKNMTVCLIKTAIKSKNIKTKIPMTNKAGKEVLNQKIWISMHKVWKIIVIRNCSFS
jgi:hypothetical protein